VGIGWLERISLGNGVGWRVLIAILRLDTMGNIVLEELV
jgi:hypothetical protein